MFNLLHSITNQELFEKHLCNPRIPKEIVPHAPVISINVLKVKYPLYFIVSLFNPLHSSMNQELFEKHLCNKIATMKKLMISVSKGSHYVLPSNRHFTVSNDEWDTKENTGKSME